MVAILDLEIASGIKENDLDTLQVVLFLYLFLKDLDRKIKDTQD